MKAEEWFEKNQENYKGIKSRYWAIKMLNDFASQFALPGKEKIIEILREFKPFIGFDEDNKKCYGNIEDNSFEFIADEILKLSDLKENSEKANKDYLDECIEKATPNLSKIKDVDREFDEIRGIKPSDLPIDEITDEMIEKRFPVNVAMIRPCNLSTRNKWIYQGIKWYQRNYNRPNLPEIPNNEIQEA
jgi:hypothetical protein